METDRSRLHRELDISDKRSTSVNKSMTGPGVKKIQIYQILKEKEMHN